MKQTTITYNAENIKYLRCLLGDEKVDTFLSIGDKPDRGTCEEQETCEKVKKCFEQMEKFNDNHWWTSKDKRVLGYYQLMNPYLLVPFDKFHEALTFLLGRCVCTHEIGLNYENIKAEAERDFKGTHDSDEQA